MAAKGDGYHGVTESCNNDLMILENQLKDALENKSFEKHVFEKKNLSRNKCVLKNKIKRTCRVWVEKGTAHSKNTCIATCFYCMKKGHHQINAILNIIMFQMGSILGCLLLDN